MPCIQPYRGDTSQMLLWKIASCIADGGGGGGVAGVLSFNSRTGVVTLTSGDVTGALGFTPAASGSGVTSFNTRTGAVTLTSADVTTALGFTPLNTTTGDARYVLKTGDTMTGALAIGNGILVADTPYLNLSQTWNNGAVTFTGLQSNVTNTASSTNSNLFNFQVDGVDRFNFTPGGSLRAVRQDASDSGLNLFLRKRGNVGGATNAIANDATIGTVAYSGWDGAAFATGSRISGLGAEAWTGIAHGARIDLYTTPTGSTTEQLTLRVAAAGSVQFLNGTAALPALTFQSDLDTGIYRVGANSLGVSVNGVLALTVDGTSLTSVGTQLGPDGTAALPSSSFTSDTDTGMYRIGANSLGFSAGGVLRLTIDGTNTTFAGALLIPDGTAALPGLAFAADTNTGIYRIGADSLGISAGGVLALTTNATGIAIPAAAAVTWTSRGTLTRPADGVSLMTDNAGTSFGRLQFGGTTNSFPSIKRNAAALDFRTADDSAYIQINTGGISANNNVSIPNGNAFYWVTQGTIRSKGDGIFQLADNAETSFNRLQFGGTTSAFPSIKRSAATLQFRLADDSAFADITAAVIASGDGTAALPAKTFSADLDTGIYRVGANHLGVSTNGAIVLGVGAAALGFFATVAAAPVAQQVSGANLTNNVTAGGVNDTIADYTDLVIYANDSAAIRNDIYQLARKLKQVNDALRAYGLLT